MSWEDILTNPLCSKLNTCFNNIYIYIYEDKEKEYIYIDMYIKIHIRFILLISLMKLCLFFLKKYRWHSSYYGAKIVVNTINNINLCLVMFNHFYYS